MNNNNQYNGPTGAQVFQDCKAQIKQIYETMPLFVRIIVFSNSILFLLNLFFPSISLYLADIPYFTICRLQIWRVATTAFITTNIISIILSMIFWVKDVIQLERSIGTIKYMLTFFMNCICIQIIFCSIMFLVFLITRSKTALLLKVMGGRVRNEGLWPIVMLEITLKCLKNPDQDMRFFLFPCVIKAKYYPLALVGFFTLLSGFNFDFEILSGIAFGYIYHRYLENRLKITDSLALKVERSVLFRWMINTPGFIRISNVDAALPANSIVVNVSNNRNTSNNANNNNNNNNSNSFKAFSGKGFAVGSSPNDSNENSNSDNRNEEYNHDRNESGSTSVDISVDSRVGLDTSNSNTSNENRNK